MIISHSRKFIFVKTKKTAGTSIECALAPYLTKGDLASPLIEHETRVRPMSRAFVRLLREKDNSIRARNPHLPITVISDHFREETNGYYSFCVERNPWDKAISAFFFWTSRRPYDPAQSDVANFVDFTLSRRLGFFSNYDMYMKNDAPQVDRILRYETLAEDFAEVTAKLGLPGATLADVRAKGDIRPKSSRSLAKFYGTDFDNAAAKRVQDVFAREIAYFGYEKPLR